ncbi:MAG: hypothetical protein ACLP0L_09340, partial [Solirubrobacteraceae bacterium]
MLARECEADARPPREDRLGAVGTDKCEEPPRSRSRRVGVGAGVDDEHDAVPGLEITTVIGDRFLHRGRGAARRWRVVGARCDVVVGDVFDEGRNREKLLPWPTVESTWISPPSSRAISRLIE